MLFQDLPSASLSAYMGEDSQSVFPYTNIRGWGWGEWVDRTSFVVSSSSFTSTQDEEELAANQNDTMYIFRVERSMYIIFA